ncbi:DMT family transporter [Coralloluteibacterium thermophilus]|uniref:DMT family transporter n=1 Tax=Coralloluteibacterium thermophilum TaxID=2707049 RepID=A0ABV9NHV3_9GAMM
MRPDSPAPPAGSATRPLALLGIAFVLVWCTGYIAGKHAIAQAGPMTTLLLRLVLAALVFAAVAAAARTLWGPPRALAHSAVAGVLLLAVQFGGMYLGMRLGATAGAAALATGSMPLLVAVLAALGGERLGALRWCGLGIGLAGVLLVVGEGLEGATPPVAWLALAASLLGIAVGTLYQKRHASSIDMRVGLAVQHGAAALVVLPLAWHEGFAATPGAAFLLPLAWLVLVNSVGGFALLFLLIRRGAASRVASLFFLVPPVTALMGYLLLGEPLTPAKVAGFACAAVGVRLAVRRESTR